MSKWQVFRALQGHKIVAGGNAPGMRDVRSPTLKGSHFLEPRDARPRWHHLVSTLSGSGPVGGRFPGALPPATISIPSGDQGSIVLRTFCVAKSR